MESIVAVLEPFHVFTDTLLGEKCIIISGLRPLLRHILEKLLVLLPTDSCFVKDKGNCIRQAAITVHTSGVIRYADVSSCLDPRFQLCYMVNRNKTIQRIKSKGLEVAGIELFNATSDKKAERLACILRR